MFRRKKFASKPLTAKYRPGKLKNRLIIDQVKYRPSKLNTGLTTDLAKYRPD